MAIASIMDLKGQLRGKRVLVRTGFDVPINDKGLITDDSRIRSAVPTIEFLHDEGARTILLSHMGRPKGVDARLSLRPCAESLEKLIPTARVSFVPFCKGSGMEDILLDMKDGDVLLLENIRFEEGEDSSGPASDALIAQMASLYQIYVNEAFSVSHRASASMVGIPKKMKSQGKPVCAGLQTLKEVQMLTPLLSPNGYSIAIIGGAKVKDKIKTIRTLCGVFSKVLIGGGMANTFLAARAKPVGKSKIEKEFTDEIRALMEKENDRIMIPLDGVKGKLSDPHDSIMNAVASGTTDFSNGSVRDDEMILDIGRRTTAFFREEIKKADTIFWNGPMGVFEVPAFMNGSKEIAEALAESAAITIVGGGDTAAAVDAVGLTDKMTWVSTGGGASQEFIENKGHLPALDVLDN